MDGGSFNMVERRARKRVPVREDLVFVFREENPALRKGVPYIPRGCGPTRKRLLSNSNRLIGKIDQDKGETDIELKEKWKELI